MDVLEQISTPPTCETCRYFDSYGDPNDTTGVCRRYPPQVPLVQVDITKWCGEYTHA